MQFPCYFGRLFGLFRQKPSYLSFIFTVVVTCVAMTLWSIMPIYPDEISFRQELGRFIQDDGVVYGLYPLCASNIKSVPIIFAPSAWVMSWLSNHISLTEFRLIPISLIMSAMGLSGYFAARGSTPVASLLTLASLVGVGGSALVMARYEWVLVLNIVVFLFWLNVRLHKIESPIVYIILVISVAASANISLYAHLQGVLFIPISWYIAFRIISMWLRPMKAIFIVGAISCIMTYYCIGFHDTKCGEFPQMMDFWRKMTIDISAINITSIGDDFIFKITKFLENLQFQKTYDVRYLPDFPTVDGIEIIIVDSINRAIIYIATLNIFITVCVALFSFRHISIVAFGFFSQNKCARFDDDIDIDLKIIVFVLTTSVMILFVYDAMQYFYRTLFINFVLSIAMSISLSRVSGRMASALAYVLSFSCGVCAVVSIIGAKLWLYPMLASGYEGPSTRISRDWPGLSRDIKELGTACGIDFSRGKILADDLTFDNFKTSRRTYQMTYLSLQAIVGGISLDDAITLLKPNSAVLRCTLFDALKVDYQYHIGDVCCRNFETTSSLRLRLGGN